MKHNNKETMRIKKSVAPSQNSSTEFGIKIGNDPTISKKNHTAANMIMQMHNVEIHANWQYR